MPSLDQVAEAQVVKLLLLGNSGAGKTGALGSLAAAGYRLFIADFDSGTDILLDEKILPREARSRVYVKNFYDKHLLTGGKATAQPKGIKDFISALSKWREGDEDLGNIYSWGPKDVFVIDSLTFLGNACMNEALSLSGHLGQRPTQPDWGAAIDQQESIIEMLYNPAVKCNVVITSHLAPISGDAAETGGVTRMFPSALGKKLPTKISRYFNNVVLIRKSGSGEKVRREFVTTATTDTDLKAAKPSKVPAIMEPDLGKLFQALLAS